MKQGTSLICSKSFAVKINGKGRLISFKSGDYFWVVNSSVDQQTRKIVHIARLKSKIGYEFSLDQVVEYFKVV